MNAGAKTAPARFCSLARSVLGFLCFGDFPPARGSVLSETMTIERRTLLAFLLSTALVGGVIAIPSRPVFAKGDGEDGGDDGDDGHDSGGDNGDDSGDDGGHDDGKGDDGGSGTKGADDADSDQDDALEAVKSGQIMSLEKALAIVNKKYDAKVIDVKLSKTFGRAVYGLKLRLANGQIKSVRIDARTGKPVGLLGF